MPNVKRAKATAGPHDYIPAKPRWRHNNRSLLPATTQKHLRERESTISEGGFGVVSVNSDADIVTSI
jgi:hypothetical protein